MICCCRSINLNVVWSHNAHRRTWTKVHSSQWAKFKSYSSQLSPAWSLAVLQSIEAFFMGIPKVLFVTVSHALWFKFTHKQSHEQLTYHNITIISTLGIVRLQHCRLYALLHNLKQITSSLLFWLHLLIIKSVSWQSFIHGFL